MIVESFPRVAFRVVIFRLASTAGRIVTAGLAVATLGCSPQREPLAHPSSRAPANGLTTRLAPPPDAPHSPRFVYHDGARDLGIDGSIRDLDRWDRIDVYPHTDVGVDATYDFTREEGVDRFTLRAPRFTEDGESSVGLTTDRSVDAAFRGIAEWSRRGVIRAESDPNVVMITTEGGTSLCTHGQWRRVDESATGVWHSERLDPRCHVWPDAPTLGTDAYLRVEPHDETSTSNVWTTARLTITDADRAMRSFELSANPNEATLRVEPVESCAARAVVDSLGAIEPLRRPVDPPAVCAPLRAPSFVLARDPVAEALLATLGASEVTVAPVGARHVALVTPDSSSDPDESLICIFDQGRAFCSVVRAHRITTSPIDVLGPDAIRTSSTSGGEDLLVLAIRDDHLALADLTVHVHSTVSGWSDEEALDAHRVVFVSSVHYPYVVRSPTCVELGRSAVWQARFDRNTGWSRATHRRSAEDGEDEFHERAGTYVLGPGGFAPGPCR